MLAFQKKYTLLALCNLLFLAYYLILGYYNQPATDDYCVLSAQRYYGFNSPISYWYLFWNARIFPLYLSNIFLTLFQKTDTTIWFTIFLITGYTFAIFRIIKKLLENLKIKRKISNGDILNFSLFVFNVFVYNNFKFNTFFWLNASTMYYGGIMFFLFGIGEIISNLKKWHSYPIILFSMTYAGTSTENHALVMVLLLIFTIIIRKLFIEKTNTYTNKKLYFATATITLFFLILIAAPGSQHRIVSDTVPQNKVDFVTFILNLFQNFVSKYVLLLGEISLMYLPFFLVVLPVFLVLIKDFFGDSSENIIPKKTINYSITICLILLVGAAIAPTIYIFGNIGPQRILTVVNALLLAFGLYLAYLIIIYFKLKTVHLNRISSIALCLIIIQLGYRFYSEIPTLKNYSAFEIKNRAIISLTPENEIPFVKNAANFNTPNLTEQVATYFLSKYVPNQLKSWSKILKHEPILPNIIDQSEIKVYEGCYMGGFRRKVQIMP